MAYLPQDPTQDPNKQQQDPNAPVVLSAPTAAESSSGSQVSADGAPKGTSSGSFTNLQKYITANQGNDAAMGQSVQQNAQTKAADADQTGSSWQKAAADTIQKNTVQDNGLASTVRSLGSGKNADINSDSFQKAYNASYQGPKAENRGSDADGYADTLGKYNRVTGYGKLAAGDQADKGALLQDVYGTGGKQYNGGERQLDSFVLGSGAGGTTALNNIAGQYGNYTGDKFEKIRDTIGSQAKQAADITSHTRDAVRDAAKGSLGDLEGQFATDKAKAEAETAADRARYAGIASGADKDALHWAGLQDPAIAYLSDPSHHADFAKFATGPQNTHTVGDYANDGEVGSYKNLAKLLKVAGADLTPHYTDDDLAHSSGTGPTVDRSRIDAANSIAGLGSSLEAAVASKKAADQQTYQQLAGQLSNLNGNGLFLRSTTPDSVAQLAGQLGMSASDLEDAQALGIDPSKYLNAGTGNFGIGDVGAADQVAQYGQLAKLLGLSADTGTHEGAGYSFDSGAFKAARDAVRAQQAQAAAEDNKARIYAPGQVAIDTNPAPIHMVTPDPTRPVYTPIPTSPDEDPTAGLFQHPI